MRRSALLVVYLSVFVDMLGFGIILPLLPFRTQQLGGSGVWLGALFTAYSAAQLLGAPILGALSDRFGRRRLLLLSLAGSVVSLAITGLAGSLGLLLTARVVAGLFGGAIAVAQAYVVDLTPPAGRTRALGMVGAAVGMGFVFGPGIGGALAPFGFAAASLTAAAIALVNLLAGLVLLPGPVVAVPRGGAPGDRAAAAVRVRTGWATWSARIRQASPVDPIRYALRRPELRTVLAVLFSVTFAFASMETTFAFLGQRRFGLTAGRLGLVFSLIGIVMAVVQGGVVGRLAGRLGDRRVAVIGAVLMGASLLGLPFLPAWAAYTCLGLLAVGQGLLSPTLSALVAERGGRDLGGVFGVGQSVSALARGAGPIIAGAAWDLRMYLPYLLAAALSGAGAALLAARVRPALSQPATVAAPADPSPVVDGAGAPPRIATAVAVPTAGPPAGR